jgi:serine/threonine protein kinase/formylglycine-generating enzyme required for sulfatase activity
MPDDDELYDAFIEEYFASGNARISASWSEELQERCRLFLKLAQSTTHGGSRGSLLATLSSDGVEADVSLSAPENQPPEELSQGRGRYVVEEEIARGGMGKILLAYDRDFRRRIAMKVLLGPGHRIATSRFLEEAQATGQLEHPNIAPVYDVGVDDGGAPFFTMKWIRGRNLDEILRAGDEEFTLIRLVQVLQHVIMGVDFAHSRGVVHRDLKPQNIMVGDFGEVLVMDWGLAKILGRAAREETTETDDEDETVMTSRAEKGIHTLRGAVQGSAAYMAPEQARGEVDQIDARTDVYCLGALLYVILTGKVPYEGATFQEVLGKARRGEIVPLRERKPDVPRALEEICQRAMALRQEDRYPTAREMYDRLQAFVEGIHDEERRRAEASRLLAEADAVRAQWEAARSRENELRDVELKLKEQSTDTQPPEEKQQLWTHLTETRRATAETQRLLVETTSAYHAVLSVDGVHADARERLAALYFERMTEAEAKGEDATADIFESLVRQQHDPTHEVRLEDKGLVSLSTEPPGAAMFLARYEEHGLLLEESELESVGTAPQAVKLSRGSYLFVLRKPGYRDVRYPVFVDRDSRLEETIRLYTEAEIPEGFIQIPQGVSVVGGDPKLFSALERSQLRIDEFFVMEYPVTMTQYCEFLTACLAQESEKSDRFYRLTPKFDRKELVTWQDGQFRPKERVPPRVPVMAIAWDAVQEYCKWLGQLLGRWVAPLKESEWERCARGADGRTFPWGNEFDAAFCHSGSSRDRPEPANVGSFQFDRSPFGVRDLAGCVREFCERERDGLIPLRGGSWYYDLPFLFRCDSRTMLRNTESKSLDAGFRVKTELPPRT